MLSTLHNIDLAITHVVVVRNYLELGPTIYVYLYNDLCIYLLHKPFLVFGFPQRQNSSPQQKKRMLSTLHNIDLAITRVVQNLELGPLEALLVPGTFLY